MPNYRRNYIGGGTYFFTVVTFNRRPWLCQDFAREALRNAIKEVRNTYPFLIDAWVSLPNHLHCIWTLPEQDKEFSVRWRLIKTSVTKKCAPLLQHKEETGSRKKREERSLWQRRFWEHTIRNERDFEAHCDYIHYNPVKHGLCSSPKDWPYSTFHRFVEDGYYPADWGASVAPRIPDGIGRE